MKEFTVSDIISLLSLIGAWITIIMLIKDKLESKRPYLQITFELVRDNLACIVLRNVGKVPLDIKKLELDEKFVNQLPKEDQKGLIDKNINNIRIFPGKQWILCLGVIIPEILENYSLKELNIKYKYSKTGKKKKYSEETNIDFKQYSRFLVYVSEIDELINENQKIEKELKSINKEVKNISASIVSYLNISDKYIKSIVNSYKKE